MAEVKFIRKEGNDSLYGKIAAPLRQVLEDQVSDKTADEQLLREMFSVRKSSNFAEASTGETGFGLFNVVDELGTTLSEGTVETNKKIIEHTTFSKRTIISMEMMQDAKAGSLVEKGAKKMKQLASAFTASRLEFATKALTSGLATTFTFGGRTFDRTTPDGQAIFSKAHTVKKDPTKTISNVYTNAFSADMLNVLHNYARNFLNDTGVVTRYIFDTIIIPGNCPALEKSVKQVLKSEFEPSAATSASAINIQYGQWKLIINPYWQVAAGAPYILMSRKALGETDGSVFFDRTPLLIKEREDDDMNEIITAKARMSCGFFDWRHVVMGGMTGGTTIS